MPRIQKSKREKAPCRRVADAAQEIEEIARSIGHRRAGEQVYLGWARHLFSGVVGHAQKLEAVRGALAFVLYEMGLVQNYTGPTYPVKPFRMLAQKVVVDDYPARVVV